VLPARMEGELYRIATEALNNALKHARATSVTVRLAAPEQVELAIMDDGCGFDPDDAQNHSGIGLAGMQERVARLGGALALRAAPGKGTELWVTVPVSSTGNPKGAHHE
jgi:two-component system, NarL family, sensor histidine kinase LiaS